jgi:hypothetical protein
MARACGHLNRLRELLELRAVQIHRVRSLHATHQRCRVLGEPGQRAQQNVSGLRLLGARWTPSRRDALLGGSWRFGVSTRCSGTTHSLATPEVGLTLLMADHLVATPFCKQLDRMDRPREGWVSDGKGWSHPPYVCAGAPSGSAQHTAVDGSTPPHVVHAHVSSFVASSSSSLAPLRHPASS